MARGRLISFMTLLALHLISGACFAQATASGSGENATANKIYVYGMAATGAVIATFVIRRAWQARGDYHLNQFRIYFSLPQDHATCLTLSEALEGNFAEAFSRNRVARATKPYPCSPDIVRFTVVLWRVLPLKWITGRDRTDYIQLARPMASDSVFQAQTMAISEATVLDWHFLAGVRSWRIATATDADTHGEPNASRGQAFFLETAAFEKFSHGLYEFLVGRGLIGKAWCDFLVEAVGHLGSTVAPAPCHAAPNERMHRLGGSKWKRRWARDKRFQCWTRETKYPKDILRLQDEVYAARLFELHPAVDAEYRGALASADGEPLG